jgi:lipopolysaccharide transport system ATP-binding protein
MDNNNLAISMQGVKKQYTLGVIGGTTLQRELQSWWAKKRGREDPNMRIGTDTRLYGQKFWALRGIDLTIRQGERIGIIGANGAGKSTLLKILARVTAPTEGEIDIWGRVSSLLEVGTGFHRELTGRENIYMNGAILGMSRAEIDERMEEIIAFSEVGEFIDTPVKRYSSGMFVRLAFAVAAHLNSEIMIMDEVLAVGDMAFQRKCLNRMQQAADEEGKTVLYVSHNMTTIRQLCARCIVLDQGQVIYDGDVEEAIALYMNLGLEENPVEIDLTKRSFSDKGLDAGIALTHLSIKDKMSPVYKTGDDMKLCISLRALRKVEGAAFRITLVNDTAVPIGSCWAPAVDFPEAGEYSLTVRVPLAYMHRGVFYANVSMVRWGDNGGNRTLDSVERAFRFEVEGTDYWAMSGRGYMRLPDGEIIDVTRKEAEECCQRSGL